MSAFDSYIPGLEQVIQEDMQLLTEMVELEMRVVE